VGSKTLIVTAYPEFEPQVFTAMTILLVGAFVQAGRLPSTTGMSRAKLLGRRNWKFCSGLTIQGIRKTFAWADGSAAQGSGLSDFGASRLSKIALAAWVE
jgi:hypothetical protein